MLSVWRARALRALRHTRTALAAKTAAAAALSWMIALHLPGPAQDYPYYAPLGAVVTMYPTIRASVRQSLQAVAAISLGAGLAFAAERLLGHGALVVAVAVGLGVLLAGIGLLGEQRSYVPIAALFVLVLGQGDGLPYATAYAGLFLLGGLVTVVVNTALPAYPLRAADEQLAVLRRAVSAHLTYLADRISDREVTDPLTRRGPDRPGLRDLTERARTSVSLVQDSRHGNIRARLAPDAAASRVEAFQALERAVLLVDDLYDLSADQPWGIDLVHLSPQLREPVATALSQLAGAVTTVGVRDTEPGGRAAVDQAVVRLTGALRRHEEDGDAPAEALLVATLITTLRRTLSALTPSERIRLSDTPM